MTLGAILIVSFILFKTNVLGHFLRIAALTLKTDELVYESGKVSKTTSSTSNGNKTVESKPQPPTKVVISELFLGNGTAPSFLELYNPAGNPTDLTNFSIRRKTKSGSETTFVSAKRFEDVVLGAHDYLLIVQASSTMQGDIYWPKSYSLPKADSSLSLYDPDGKKIDEISWSVMPPSASLARISWESNEFGILENPTPQGSF